MLARTITPDDALVEYLAGPRHEAALEAAGQHRRHRRRVDRGPRHQGHPRPGQGQATRAGQRGRPRSSSTLPPPATPSPSSPPPRDSSTRSRSARSGPRPRTWSTCWPTRPVARSSSSPCRRRHRSTRSSRPPIALEDRVGCRSAPVVVNGLYPRWSLDEDPGAAGKRTGVALDAERRAAPCRRGRASAASARRSRPTQIARLDEALPLPQLQLPFLFTSDIGPGELDTLADALASSIEGL